MDAESLKLAAGGILAVAVAWFAVTRLVRFLTWVEKSEIARQAAEAQEAAARKKAARAASAGPAVQQGIPAQHVAAIAAAVAACGYRVAHIADPRTGRAWAAEGRRMQQTSHSPH